MYTQRTHPREVISFKDDVFGVYLGLLAAIFEQIVLFALQSIVDY
jgi:hypothetical protein